MKKLIFIVTFLMLSHSWANENNLPTIQPYLELELLDNEGKNIIIECPKKRKKQTIIASNGRHTLKFDIGDFIYIYDSSNKNGRKLSGEKKGAIKMLVKPNQSITGRYTANFESLTVKLDENDISLINYIQQLKEPYLKIWQKPDNVFDYHLYDQGVSDLQELNDSILKTEISNDAKINILLEALQWRFLSLKKMTNYLTNDVDTLKVSKSLLKHFNKTKSIKIVKYDIGDSLNFDKLYSYLPHKIIDLDNLDKDINVLFFTASWCGNCKRYIKPLTNLKNKFPENIDIIAINFDDNQEAYTEYMKNLEFNFVSELKPMKESTNGKNFHIKSLPEIMVIDKNKKVILNNTQAHFFEYQMNGILKKYFR